METLKEFMLLFRMQTGNAPPSAEQTAAMQQQWGMYIGNIAAQAKLVNTSRLGFEGNIIDNSTTVNNGTYVANQETLTGNMLIKAASLEEGTEIAKGCPVLAMGGTVEVRSIIPMQF